jgi:hypothetical protein
LINRTISLTSAASASSNAVREAAVNIRHFEAAACQKEVAVARGVPQNSDYGAAV